MSRSKMIPDAVATVYSARFDELPPFADVLEATAPTSDEGLAAAIAADAQMAMRHGVAVSYYRYARIVDLDGHPLAREAALDAWALSLYDSDRCDDLEEARGLVRTAVAQSPLAAIGSAGAATRRRAGIAGLTDVSRTTVILGVLLLAAVIWGAYGHLRRAQLAKVAEQALALAEQSGQASQVQVPHSEQDDSTPDD